MSTTHISRPFDVTASVNDLLRDHPSVVGVLESHGIDTCCGGALSLWGAARDAGVSLDLLLGDIERSLREGIRDNA